MGQFDGRLTAGQRYQQRISQAQPGQAAQKFRGLVSAMLDQFPTPAMQQIVDLGNRRAELREELRSAPQENRRALMEELARTMLANPFMGFGVGNIKAYHGSPHIFTQFSTKNIGTGEGAQAYGHGLYFAENPAVAQQYSRNLSQWPALEALRRNPGKLPKRAVHAAQWIYANKGLSAEKQARARQEWRAGLKALEPKATDADIDAWLKQGEEIAREVENKGSLYEVNIKPEPEDFLDWDKPLSQQSEKVRKAFQQMGIEPREGVYAKGVDAATAAKWRQAGIRGIRYKDAGSRGAIKGAYKVRYGVGQGHASFDTLEEAQAALAEAKSGPFKDATLVKPPPGTHNYVVFDDADVEILSRK